MKTNFDGDLVSDDGSYTLTRKDAATTMKLITATYTPAEYLGQDHTSKVICCGAALASVQGMDAYSGYMIYMGDTESFAYDVAHAMAHFMIEVFEAMVSSS